MSDDAAAEFSDEEATQLVQVLDVCLERGFDIDGVDRSVLERARERFREQAED